MYTSHTNIRTTESGKVLWSCEGDQSGQDLLPVGEVGTSGNLCPVAVNDSTHELWTWEREVWEREREYECERE